jgi:hypothetical protein
VSREPEFFDHQIDEQNEIADYILGIVARRDGKPLDSSKSAAWQRGWAKAQE